MFDSGRACCEGQMTALIELKDLAIRTEERMLVEGVSMTVQPGRVTALIGPSGSGKSLTARCSMGVIDVLPGLVHGELRYPEVDPEKDWYKGLHGGDRLTHRPCWQWQPMPSCWKIPVRFAVRISRILRKPRVLH